MQITPANVYLVGAGPGDPGLLTLRGKECLARADVVLYDYLASAELLEHAPATAERICLGRHGAGRLLSQEEINRMMVEHALAGRTVVRLKGGDPGIFGRLAEEAAALQTAGIHFEVVPGVTTALAAGTYAGITLTDRDQSSCVAFITGREQAGKSADDSLDYGSLTNFPGTLVFYMGVTTAPVWSRALLSQGKSPQTPVMVVRHCSLPQQQTWQCQLGEVEQLLSTVVVRPPVVVIVGNVVSNATLGNWFTERPLFGQTILVTRPVHQAGSMAQSLRERGAHVLCQPAIEIGPPADWKPVDAVIKRLGEFDWLVFSSRNGVDYFLNRLRASGLDWRAFGGVKIASIGSATTAALAERELNVDLEPDEFRAEALAESLGQHAKGKQFLLLRASRGREVLAESLTAAGGIVDQVVTYDSHDVMSADPDITRAMAAGEIDWVTVTSSATAASLVQLFGDSLRQTKLATISPLTGQKLTELGFPPTVMANEYTSDGLVTAICKHT